MDTIINLLKSYNFFPGANVSLIMLINKTDGRFSTIFFLQQKDKIISFKNI